MQTVYFSLGTFLGPPGPGPTGWATRGGPKKVPYRASCGWTTCGSPRHLYLLKLAFFFNFSFFYIIKICPSELLVFSCGVFGVVIFVLLCLFCEVSYLSNLPHSDSFNKHKSSPQPTGISLPRQWAASRPPYPVPWPVLRSIMIGWVSMYSLFKFCIICYINIFKPCKTL